MPYPFKKILLLVLLSSSLLSQPMSSDFWPVRNHEWLLDLGVGWEIHSLFQPLPYGSFERYYGKAKQTPRFWPARELTGYWRAISRARAANPGAPFCQTWIGFLGQVSETSPDGLKNDFGSTYWTGEADYRDFFAEWYLRAASSPTGPEHFTGRARDIRRLGMNSAELDQASVGYRNDWLTIAYGRGREVWGPFQAGNPMLSASCAAYDHVSASFSYKKITFSFFTGFLESIQDTSGVLQNRYITGHGLQYSNGKNLRAAAGEVTVYSGPNRRFDWAYLNPLTPHLEPELNDRENLPYSVSNASNAVWFISADWMLPRRTRLSAEYVIDEFQFDQKDREQGRPDATALKLRLNKAMMLKGSAFMVWTSFERVGTFTFRHGSAYGAFVSRNLPLGTPLGSDFDAWRVGLRAILPFPLQIEASYGGLRQGGNGLLANLYTPYENFTETAFPSETVQKSRSMVLNLQYSFRSNLELEARISNKHFINMELKDQTTYALRLNGCLTFIRTF